MGAYRVRVWVLAAASIMILPGFLVRAPAAPVPSDLPVPVPGGAVVFVTILRDAYGKPHMFAPPEPTEENVYALFYANGYAQAQERLFQIEVLRHVGRGDSASFLGAGQLGSDLAVRRELYTPEERDSQFQGMSPQGQATLRGFVDGVNRYLTEARANLGGMPVEPLALGHPIEDFTVDEVVAIINYLISFFGDGGGNELHNLLVLARLRAALGDDEAAFAALGDLAWMRTGDAAPTIPIADLVVAPTLESPMDGFADLPVEQQAMVELADRLEGFGGAEPALLPVEQLSPFGHLLGSNAVLVDGDHSESGHPLMWGAPQMGYFFPNVPYEVGLHGAGYDASGIGVTGAPGIVIGRTPTFAWSVTSGASDQTDLVGFEVVDWTARTYRTGEAVLTLDCHTEHHTVFSSTAGAPPAFYEQEVCRSVAGPVVARAIRDDGTGFVYARKSSHRMLDLDSAERWLGQAGAVSLAEFDANLEEFAFTFNFFYADANTIAYRHVGHQPVRPATYDHRLPMPGVGHDWLDVLHGQALPRVQDPSTGWLANWNNLPARGWSGGDDRNLWGQGHRVELLQGLLGDAFNDHGGRLSLAQLQDVHNASATRDPFARHVVPFLLDALQGATGVRAQARSALESWAAADYCWCDAAPDDGVYDHDGHAIWDAWRTELQRRVFEDELGDLFLPMDFSVEDEGTGGDPHGADHAAHRHKDPPLLHALAGDSALAWFDDVTTSTVESPTQVLLEALDAVLADGVPSLDVHHNVYTSLTAFPNLRHELINRGTYVQFVDWGTGAAENVLAPGTWGLVDAAAAPLGLADPALLATYNPHFLDQFDLYANFAYRPFWFTEAQVRDHLDGTVTLGGARGETLLAVPLAP